MKKIINNFNKYFKYIINIIIKNKHLIIMALPFIIMDLSTRMFTSNINFYKTTRIMPNFFTLLWITFFISLIINNKKKIGKILYIIITSFFLLIYFTINIYYGIMSNVFSFNILSAASEGAPYFLEAIKKCNPLVYIVSIITIISIIYGYKELNKNIKYKPKRMLIIIGVFIIIHAITPLFYGKTNSELVWNNWKKPRYIYNEFNDKNKSLRICGLYEYTLRDFYITYLKYEKENENDIEFLDEVFNVASENTKNSYTGKYKNKNLIILQLEGIDNWLITKEDTPTLYKMMNKSINFPNHYSFYNGGGSTFNSEFAVNTGYIMPLSYNKNAYTFNNNYYPYSLANLFKNEGYTINAFHMNTGEYYSRKLNYLNFGYDNYYGLIDMFDYNDYEYELDRELILNEEYSDLMFPENTNFVDYIITYTPHFPFSEEKGTCKILNDLDNENATGEEACVRRQAKETDYMVELLLDKLKEKNLLNDTIIVVYTDHYLYTIEDKTILDKYKDTSNNLINNTPFFIYDGKTSKTIKSVNSQIDILPTILNLFGIKYNSVNYLGNDILAKNYNGIVFFTDYSWYNGKAYVDGGKVTNNVKISNDLLEENTLRVNYLAQKNDLVLKYDYFRRQTKKETN